MSVQAPIFSSIYLRKHIALPQDHGSWVFLFSPLLIGLFAGGQFTPTTAFLILAVVAGFLFRQPASIAVKVASGRRPKRDLNPALFWLGVYALMGLVGIVGIFLTGDAFILLLAIPGVPVFAWHLYLVSRRAERRQMGVEIVASGVLALAAPAGLWVGLGRIDSTGWLLWALVWLQSAASIVHAYMRLEQREQASVPPLSERLKQHSSVTLRALLYTSFNLALAIALAIFQVAPWLIPLPYALQWLETVWGAFHPATGMKPTAIGVRQLVVSTLFTLLFILAWQLS
jgi:hypothetical protein